MILQVVFLNNISLHKHFVLYIKKKTNVLFFNVTLKHVTMPGGTIFFFIDKKLFHLNNDCIL